MNTTSRRYILAITSLIGTYVGAWAAAAPHSFYDSFPGLGMIWVAVDGPFNEHLIRDVGALYLALAAGGVLAAASDRADAGRVVGLAWLVFSVPHLTYHLAHLDGFSVSDAVWQVVSLSSTIVLALPLVWSARKPDRARPDESPRPPRSTSS